MILSSPTSSAPSFSSLYLVRDRIEQAIAQSISCLGEKNKLRDACEFALTSNGKRIRPLIVMLVAEALGHGLSVVESALLVEYFHTASLIIDDLPAMDNEEMRRGRPTVHKIYGEPVAILASYALMTAAFEKIAKNAHAMRESGLPFARQSDRASLIALEAVAKCGGIQGATGGQFFDLFPKTISLESIKELIYKKTVTLFEGSFVLGWVFGGGDFSLLPLIKQTAYHMGFAFQIADDISDIKEDEKKRKTVNIVSFLGLERSLILFQEEMEKMMSSMQSLGLFSASFEKLAEQLYKSVAKAK